MHGQTLIQDVPTYVQTIAQFKNNLITDNSPYNYGNLLVCYLRCGNVVESEDDDELINFDRTYYVIIKPIECDEHLPDNNNHQSQSLILNFDDDSESESEDEEDEEDEDEEDEEDKDEDEEDEEDENAESDYTSDSDSDMTNLI